MYVHFIHIQSLISILDIKCNLPADTSPYYSCAALNGINQAIVDRANELIALSARGENLVAACAVLSAQEMQALQDAVSIVSCLFCPSFLTSINECVRLDWMGGWMAD